MPQTREELLEDFEKLLDIQCSDGNWDADPYMHGMANGMILFHSMARNPTGDPDFKTAPLYWKSRIWRNVKKLKLLRKKLWLYFQWITSSIISNITGLEFEFKKNGSLITYREQ